MRYLLIYQAPNATLVDPPDASYLGFRCEQIEFDADNKKSALQWVKEFVSVGTVKVQDVEQALVRTSREPPKLYEVSRRHPLWLVQFIKDYKLQTARVC